MPQNDPYHKPNTTMHEDPAGFEFQWQCRWRIWPCLVSDWLAGGLSKQTQPTTRLACSNGHECYRLGNDCKTVQTVS